MTEIQWLCDILLSFKLQKPIKDRFIARIGEVEAELTQKTILSNPSFRPTISAQAPSTQKLLDEMAQQTGSPIPIESVAQTQVAAQALRTRQEAILSAGKIEPGRTSPRKF